MLPVPLPVCLLVLGPQITDVDMNGVNLFPPIGQVQPDTAGTLIAGAPTEPRRRDAVSTGMPARLEKPNPPATLPPFVNAVFPPSAEDAA